jgi:hypothetical protein
VNRFLTRGWRQRYGFTYFSTASIFHHCRKWARIWRSFGQETHGDAIVLQIYKFSITPGTKIGRRPNEPSLASASSWPTTAHNDQQSVNSSSDLFDFLGAGTATVPLVCYIYRYPFACHSTVYDS